MLFFSPDGEWIGFERGAGLAKVAVSGGSPLTILDDAGAQILGGAWDVEGTVIFATRDGLYRVPAAGGGSVERLAPARRGQFYFTPRVIPGTNAVVFYMTTAGGPAGWESSRVAVLSLETGEQRILIEGANPVYASSGHLVFARGTTLMAAPFDVEQLEVTGDPVALVEDIRRDSAADYALSENGTLVYVPGESAAGGRTLAWVGRDGREEVLAMEPRNYLTVK